MNFKIRRIRLLAAVAILASLLLNVSTPAQSEKGPISGKVTDSQGAVLQGAEIVLEPVGAHAVSDEQGRFFINSVAVGHYTVNVTYVGFAALVKEVDVTTGQPFAVDAKMELSSVNTQVLVTAERAAGEAEAINGERSADNIVQVLPADVIRSLPNANMADALGRLPSVTLERDEGEGSTCRFAGPEPRLTNTTIDGINVPSPESGVRQIKFDAIPADLVESVEINKTLQANMDGDGIGGSINLVTKTATERPTIALSGMGGYMPILGGRGQVESTGTIGQRFGSSKTIWNSRWRFLRLDRSRHRRHRTGIRSCHLAGGSQQSGKMRSTFANIGITGHAGVRRAAPITNSARDRISMRASCIRTSRTMATGGFIR